MPISLLNNKGFTLAELMVSILISIIGLFALLQSLDVVTLNNVKNQMRDEAAKIGDEKMQQLKANSTFTQISTLAVAPQTTMVKSSSSRLYKVTNSSARVSSDASSDLREVIVTVGWSYKNYSSYHQVRSVKSRYL